MHLRAYRLANENAMPTEILDMGELYPTQRLPPLWNGTGNSLQDDDDDDGRFHSAEDFPWAGADLSFNAWALVPPPILFQGIALNILSFIFVWYASGQLQGSGDEELRLSDDLEYPRCSLFTYLPQRRFETWRFLSYSLAHDGWYHLVTNCLLYTSPSPRD